MRSTAIGVFIFGAICLVNATADAQVRHLGDVVSGPMHIEAIRMATVNAWDMLDAGERQNRYPGFSAGDFDRNRDGEFLAEGSGWGLFDLSAAIIQFTHDSVDLDEDGVPGFYELECVNSVQGIVLDPNAGRTSPGIDDGQVDCDGDGQSNAFELSVGLNPLDPDDLDADVDGDGVSNIAEVNNNTFTPAVMRLIPFEPTDDGVRGLVGLVLVVDQPQANQAPTGTTVVLSFDPSVLEFHSAEWSSEYDRLNPDRVAQPALYQFGSGGCSRAPAPADCVRLTSPDHFQFGGVGPFGPVVRPVDGEPYAAFATFYFRPLASARTQIRFVEEDVELFPPGAQQALTFGAGAIGREIVLEVQP